MKLLLSIPWVIGVRGGVSSIRFPRPDISLIVALVVPMLLWSSGVGRAQAVDPALWVTNGAVYSVVPDGLRTIYIGGSFTVVGPFTGSAGAIDASTGAPQQPYPKVAGTVQAVAPDGSGGWYLGGAFTEVGGQPRNNLAQLDAGGNLTAWNPNPNNTVYALAVSGSTVYAGGYFTNIGGQPRNRIAALDAATGAASAWNPNADEAVEALAVNGGTVYVGGWFSTIGGQPRNRIAALDATTGAATAWIANANNPVYSLAVSGVSVYAGGGFTSIGGQPRVGIAALNAATGAVSAFQCDVFAPDGFPSVRAVAVSGGTVYVGGWFSAISGLPRNNIAAVTATGAVTGWNPDAGPNPPPSPVRGAVDALEVSGGTVYAGGHFTSIGGQPRSYIAALDAATGAATAWDPTASSVVYALAASGGTVYAGGPFTSIGGRPRNNIAALDAVTGAATAWNPNASGGTYVTTISALVVSGATVYAGGDFTSIGGQPRNYIAALDAATGAATAWNPNANGLVRAVAMSGGTLYAGGDFTSIGGQGRNRIAALDPTTGAATAWNPNASGGATVTGVYALAMSGDTVYAGGQFSIIGGQPRHNIAALDAASGGATAWNPNANDFGVPAIAALAVSGGAVYAAGGFTSIGGQPRVGIAALDAATGAATAWNPNPSTSQVYALVVRGGTVYAGGGFTSIGGAPRNRIAALDVATGAATAWDPNVVGIYPAIYALAVSGGTVYAGGVNFQSVGGLPRSGIAAITEGHLVSVGGDPSITEGSLTVAPNPTPAGMQIQYSVVRSGRVRLELLDVSGRVEATLADRVQEPGRHVATWDGVGRRGRLSPGLHFIRLVTADRVMVRKLAIIW